MRFQRPDRVDCVEELCVGLRFLAFRDATLQGVQPLLESRQLRIIGERDDQLATGRVDDTKTRLAEFFSVYGRSEFEDQDQARINPECWRSLHMPHRDVGNRFPDAAAVPREIVVATISRREPQWGASATWFEGALKLQQR